MLSSKATRRHFLLRTALLSGAAFLLPKSMMAQQAKAEFPPLPAERVKAFVIAGHGNIDKVKEMLIEIPTLLNACWDWRNGDFETALEGAGHVGNRDCAEYLISKGARANVFVLAMLGKLETVQALLTAYPILKDSTGPHGLGLIHHATKGGEASKAVLSYLQSLGLK